jgi:ATP-dependent Clp protease ATP-binding subunit ClpA
VVTDLAGFGLDARRAIAAAEREARELGHAVVGTEHLLLGLLADETSSASGALRDAGATLSAARAKVREAVGVRSGATIDEQAQTASARATRALGRAARFSHSRRAPTVTSEHLLEGVLDVEGTAGQVLRGIGVDVERLRARLAGEPAVPWCARSPSAATRRSTRATCRRPWRRGARRATCRSTSHSCGRR